MNKIKNSALLTDLYELTMAASYLEHGMNETAVFSLFVRQYPPNRRYFVFCGLKEVLDYLAGLQFTKDDLEYLESTDFFKPEFISYLENFSFHGDMHAMPEGTVFFEEEPILEVTAPLIEAQVIETFLINSINLQTMIATKASRCVHAAGQRSLVDFSFRRTQGIDASIKVAKASYIAGFLGTSNVLAGKQLGIPVYGTMAHSFVSSFDKEINAFRAFTQTFPENSILLVDTYDSLSGILKAAQVGKEMAGRGEHLKGIRLDSGDMAGISRKARRILDGNGLKNSLIFASGAFDEYKIQKILSQKAAIDSFGVGTKMGVSSDAPYLDMAYKIVKYNGESVVKLSPEKTSLTSDKQVFRFLSSEKLYDHDVIACREEEPDGGIPLLAPVITAGKIIYDSPPLSEIRNHFKENFSRLPEKYKTINKEGPLYPVKISEKLRKLQKKTIDKYKKKEIL
ncbi:MAG TPA: nicotinate phosphoribosyltransferase [Candidatus Aminicenantes bacterium]|nr:nicotinate phosphoribosyltransferase [Candidatus Aminicenantes bacterium]